MISSLSDWQDSFSQEPVKEPKNGKNVNVKYICQILRHKWPISHLTGFWFI